RAACETKCVRWLCPAPTRLTAQLPLVTYCERSWRRRSVRNPSEGGTWVPKTPIGRRLCPIQSRSSYSLLSSNSYEAEKYFFMEDGGRPAAAQDSSDGRQLFIRCSPANTRAASNRGRAVRARRSGTQDRKFRLRDSAIADVL